MNRKNTLLIILLFCISLIGTGSLLSQDSFTIYLVRHAEKVLTDKNDRNPELTDCGHQRAESLAQFFDQVDIGDVYSSDYARTISTAQPLAESKNTTIQIYNPRQPESFAQKLKEYRRNALVVGHSNSTPTLANTLLQKPDAFNKIDESEYDYIFQLVFMGDNIQATIFKSNFRCVE